jgi:hypothetical protein
MKNKIDVDRRSNVIPLSFRDRRKVSNATDDEVENIPNEIAHPSSKHYPKVELSLDPLDEILTEFEDLDLNLDIDELEDNDFQDNGSNDSDFIFHHQKSWDYQLDLSDSTTEMADIVLQQIKRLKEDSKRIKYYLNELNLD